MRVFSSACEMLDETVREVFSRGRVVYDLTRQAVRVEGKEYEQVELLNYAFTLTILRKDDMEAMLRLARRIFGEDKDHFDVEIAEAWVDEIVRPWRLEDLRYDTWWRRSKFLRHYWEEVRAIRGEYASQGPEGFAYTYSERVYFYPRKTQLDIVVDLLRENPERRAAFVSIWHPLDLCSVGRHRVPCTIGYHFYMRPYKDSPRALHLTAYMRSCDLCVFFPLDVYKAYGIQRYVAEAVGAPLGTLTMFISSLHAYWRDVPEQWRW